jgi:hypothetical protein
VYGDEQVRVVKNSDFGTDFLYGVVVIAQGPQMLAQEQEIRRFALFPFGQVIGLEAIFHYVGA